MMAEELPRDLPRDLPSFLKRFGTDAKCRAYLVRALWPEGFRCAGCGHDQAYSHRKRLIEECRACGKQHSILAGTIFEQTKTGLAKWFLAIYLVTSSKGGISALSAPPTSLRGIGRSPMELQRQMGFGSYQTAWSWLHKIRRAMVRPGREPLRDRVETDETLIGGPRPGKPGRGAAGKTVIVGAVEAGRGKAKGRRLGRLRLARLPDASAKSLTGFLVANLARPAAVARDGWSGYRGLTDEGFAHEPINLRRSWGDAALRLPGIHLVFSLAKRWLLGTHHGAVRPKHLPAYLEELVLRFNRRTARAVSHGFARLVGHAVRTPPVTYRGLVHGVGA
jgi:transposase-like protein